MCVCLSENEREKEKDRKIAEKENREEERCLCKRIFRIEVFTGLRKTPQFSNAAIVKYKPLLLFDHKHGKQNKKKLQPLATVC